MTSVRSSVRPKSSKQPWGTILKPEFGMGHQKMNEYEIDQTVERLAQLPEKRERVYEKPRCAKLDKEGINSMVRLSVCMLVVKWCLGLILGVISF